MNNWGTYTSASQETWAWDTCGTSGIITSWMRPLSNTSLCHFFYMFYTEVTPSTRTSWEKTLKSKLLSINFMRISLLGCKNGSKFQVLSLSFKSVDETPLCEHSNESFWAVFIFMYCCLSCCSWRSCSFGIHEWNLGFDHSNESSFCAVSSTCKWFCLSSCTKWSDFDVCNWNPST